MNLVIVESPTKARTISRFLGKEYEIKATIGHVMDLPKSQLGVDVEHNFEPLFEVVNDKKKIISELKSSAKNASSIILATDPDREGEAIASHVKDMLGSNSKFNPSTKLRTRIQNSKFLRIVFHEITKEAIEEALKNPRSINTNLVDAQTARRILDRLVGYKLSPLLWKKVRRGLSAGRVQSVALRLIVEREREIKKFGKEEYWTIHTLLTKTNKPVILGRSAATTPESLRALHDIEDSGQARMTDGGIATSSFELIEINGKKIEVAKTFDLYDGQYKISKTSIDSAEKAQEIASDLKTKAFTVVDVLQKESKRSPAPPYTTSTLQQDAARRLGINGKRTMSLAQKLYEEGYITYHRTDSVTISSSAVFSIVNFVKKEYGEKYAPSKPRFYSTKQKLAQEAHEAIRPTAVGQISRLTQGSAAQANIQYQISNVTGEYGWKLYEMIWRRAVASQMSDAIIESTTVIVDAVSDNSEYSESQIVSNSDNQTIRKTDSPSFPSVPKKYRFKANGSVLVFDGFLKVNPLGLSDNKLAKFSAKQNLHLIESNAVAHETMPPPRYNDSSIIKALEEKGIGRPSTYATIVSTIEGRQYIEREQGRFIPTSIGIAVNDFLVANFSTIDDIPFTASMEDELDNIAQGKKDWRPMMKDFYTPFEKRLEEVEGAERVKIAVEETNEKCLKCRSILVIRTGRFGKFLSCSKFPECKFTKPFTEETGLSCPKCGSPTLTQASAGKGGKIVIKKTRKGRKFYGCNNYPGCTFAAWKLEDISRD